MGRVALVTSGLGTALGGIGVVAEMMHDALRRRREVVIWRHNAEHRALRRLSALAAVASLGTLGGVDFIVYEHVDLARLSVAHPLLRHVPYAIFIHGTEVWRPLSALHRSALERARLVMANSAYTAKRAKECNPAFPHTVVVPLGVSEPRRGAIALGSERAPVALIASRMDSGERYKGHDTILDSWPGVVAEVSQAELHVVGGGNDRARLERRVDRERIPNVKFLGRISDQELDDEYARARVFLFPSSREGFGLAAAEAALRGVPVVALRGSAVEEVLPDGAGSVLIRAHSPQALTDATLPLLRDPAAALALGERGARRMRANYLRSHFEARFENAIDAVFRTC